MIHLDLDEQEREVLGKVLQNYLSDLSYEIADTDNMDFRNELKAKRAVLEKIQQALGKVD
jgi:hypothetical protein